LVEYSAEEEVKAEIKEEKIESSQEQPINKTEKAFNEKVIEEFDTNKNIFLKLNGNIFMIQEEDAMKKAELEV